MTGRHESPPVGSASREATAPPYIGKRRQDPGYVACPSCGGQKFSINLCASKVECARCGLVLDTPGGVW